MYSTLQIQKKYLPIPCNIFRRDKINAILSSDTSNFRKITGIISIEQS